MRSTRIIRGRRRRAAVVRACCAGGPLLLRPLLASARVIWHIAKRQNLVARTKHRLKYDSRASST